MPKLKTKSSAKKRFRLTSSGKVRANPSFKRHNLRKRPKKMKRKARGTMILSAADARDGGQGTLHRVADVHFAGIHEQGLDLERAQLDLGTSQTSVEVKVGPVAL